MSRFHVPVPDYDFTVRQGRNPYIPTPDYTLKNHRQKNRPSLNNIGSEFAPPNIAQNVPEFREIELPPIRIPIEVSAPVQKQPSFRRPTIPDRQPVSKLPDENFNYPEIKQHSYMEDRNEEERHISTKEHIKQIGVPVLPGIATPIFSAQNYELSAAPVATDQNRAYLRHLENHKKFDTLRGDRGIDDCEICQIMRKQLEAEKQDSGHHSWEQPKYAGQHVQNHSSSGSRKRREDVRNIFPIEEQPEPEPYFRAISARARHNYVKRREEEISIQALEKVDILHLEREYALCRKSDNTIGWIPSSVFEL
uniref:SH3 domain-containing protein n=1 Tax=Caenorhabditis tropicalis TaxID=1561998 RepID=A0A1I7T9M9_9PELO